MIIPRPKDAVHKAWLYRVLTAMADDASLAARLYFKGGTCAAMLGYLDRFSIDLDFDFVGTKRELGKTRARLADVFTSLGLAIKDQSKTALQYFLKYDAPVGERNTIKIDANFPPPAANRYEAKRLPEIDRIVACQTVDTMMANKLVALMDRHAKHEAIAGRDLYDIHRFFLGGFRYNPDIIRERTKKEARLFLTDLVAFINRYVTDDIITQDLGVLLPYEKFRRIRQTLKQETLMFLRDEIKRIDAGHAPITLTK